MKRTIIYSLLGAGVYIFSLIAMAATFKPEPVKKAKYASPTNPKKNAQKSADNFFFILPFTEPSKYCS